LPYDQPEESTLGDRYWRSRGGHGTRFRGRGRDADNSGGVCRRQYRGSLRLPVLCSTLSATAIFSAAATPVGLLPAAARVSATVIWICASRCGGAPGSVDHLHPRRAWTDAAGRQYKTTREVNGRPAALVYGTACRSPDGQWRIVN